MPEFELRLGGFVYSGWEDIRITRGIEEFAHAFSVRVTDQLESDRDLSAIHPGSSFSVAIDGSVIITGYIDNESKSYSKDSRTIGFAGRSKTGDLIDCASVHKSGQWRNRGLLDIASDLCEPFGIDASTNVDLGGKFRRFKIQESETVFNTIERAARMRGVLVMTNSDGNLVFDRAGTTKVSTKLEPGVAMRAAFEGTWEGRFSEYTIKTQAAGEDGFFGNKVSSIKKKSTDAGIDRYRPLIILAENEETGAELQKRADWERNVRAGRGARLSYTVQGWSHRDGLWEPNQLVVIRDPYLDLYDEMLISAVTNERSSAGTKTTLDLTLKDAFDVQPLPSPKKNKSFLESFF